MAASSGRTATKKAPAKGAKKAPAKKATAARTTKKAAKKSAARKRSTSRRRKVCPCGCGEAPLQVPAGCRYDAGRADRAVRFFPTYLRHIKGRWAGRPFELEPWQEWHIVRPVFGVVERDTGLRFYREALIGLARKNGKSELAAGIALYLLIADGEFGAEVYSLAGSKKQAGIVYKTAKQMVTASPPLAAVVQTYRREMEVPESGSTYEVLSSDADLQHGLNPHGAVIDEYHVHANAEQYEAMTTGEGARLQPLIVTISTAGPEEEGPLWDLLERARAGTDDRLYLYWVGAGEEDDPHHPAVWRRCNPASWITDAYLERQHKRHPLQVFERLHLNRFPSREAGSWLPPGAWDGCDLDAIIDPSMPCIVAVDAAPKRDKTAVVLVQRDHEGIHNVRCWVFEADPNLGYLDFDLVEGLIRQLAQDFYVTRVVVDPYAMIRSMMTLAEEGLPVEDFPQNHSRMAPASMGLHQLIIDGLIAHGGDSELTEAVRNAAIRETSFGWRLDKARASKRIDPVIALAMGTWIAELEAMSGSTPTVIVE